MAMWQYQTESPEETRKVAENLVQFLRDGDTIALYGKLGSGKTTFVQGLARGLGIKLPIVSPTYTLVRQYGRLIHVDLYRLENREQVQELGLVEYFAHNAYIVVVEWAEKIEDLLPKRHIKVKLEFTGEGERKITIEFREEDE